MLLTVNIISFDPIQELVYFVTQCAFVELDLLLFGVPFKKYNAEFFLMWRGTSPFESFLSKKCSGIESTLIQGGLFYWSALNMTKCQPLKELSELVLPKKRL